MFTIVKYFHCLSVVFCLLHLEKTSEGSRIKFRQEYLCISREIVSSPEVFSFFKDLIVFRALSAFGHSFNSGSKRRFGILLRAIESDVLISSRAL